MQHSGPTQVLSGSECPADHALPSNRYPVTGMSFAARWSIWHVNSSARVLAPSQPQAPLSGQPLPYRGPNAAWWIGW